MGLEAIFSKEESGVMLVREMRLERLLYYYKGPTVRLVREMELKRVFFRNCQK